MDLFAGSGALGFEAASRSAKSVTLVEKNKRAVEYLRQNSKALSADNCKVELNSAEQFLTSSKEQYDIVFLDPPYKAHLWEPIAQQLMSLKRLTSTALIYLECPANEDLPTLPDDWVLRKEKKAGSVRYCLFQNEIGEMS